jgi:hypothetical protein
MASTTTKNNYVLPHLRGKMPPKALTSEDINNASLFPVLSPTTPSSASPKSPVDFFKNSINFSNILKNEPILPTVMPKDRTVLYSHPLKKVVVYDISDEEMCILKGDPSFFADPVLPTKKKKGFFSFLDDYIEDNMSYMSEND